MTSWRSLPVVLYSAADDDSDDIVEARRLGAQDYMGKVSRPMEVVGRYADA